jgi:hypothetical protein
MTRQITRLMLIAAVSVCLCFLRRGFSQPNCLLPLSIKKSRRSCFEHCVNCHRPGEIGSAVSLLTYERARNWAESIKKTIVQREMPPWPGGSHKEPKVPQ